MKTVHPPPPLNYSPIQYDGNDWFDCWQANDQFYEDHYDAWEACNVFDFNDQ